MSLKSYSRIASVVAAIMVLVMFSVAALATDAEIPGLTQAINAGSQAEKLGFIGTLVVFVVLLIITLTYLLRLLFGKLVVIVEQNVKALSDVTNALREVMTAIQNCKH